MQYIVFHKSDLDGHCAGALCRQYFQALGKDVRMTPADYGDSLDVLDGCRAGDEVWFVDFVPNDHQVVLDLADRVKVAIIDHHKTTIPLWERLCADGKDLGSVQMGRAACELVYDYFYDAIPPQYVELLGQYDTWRKDKDWDTRVLPFQWGLRSYQTDPATDEGMSVWDRLARSYAFFQQILNEGCAIIRYQHNLNARIMENAFEAEFEGLRALVLVGGGAGSTGFQSKWNPAVHDVMVWVVNRRNEFWTVSLYTEKELDLTPIAKKYGGGGHPKACGFQIDNYYRLFPMKKS